MEITEKVAYLKGLAEGMELDTEKKEGKLLAAIIDVLDDIALELADKGDLIRAEWFVAVPAVPAFAPSGRTIRRAAGPPCPAVS